jgi:hypothetical protein
VYYCRAAEVQGVAEEAPRWPDITSRGLGSPSVEAIVMCYLGQG